jgi:tetratricopeptide (TPR) repeat protein
MDVEKLIESERWDAARAEIRRLLRREPTSHWLLTRLSLTYYEQYRYRTALRYAEAALAIQPRCPLALWDYAGDLQMLGRHREALDVYRRIVRRGATRIATGECGEGLARARGLVADCHYRMAQSYKDLGDRRHSDSHFEKHLDLRGPGCQSIYRLEELKL